MDDGPGREMRIAALLRLSSLLFAAILIRIVRPEPLSIARPRLLVLPVRQVFSGVTKSSISCTELDDTPQRDIQGVLRHQDDLFEE